jgi:hypothetical protein
MYVNNTTSFFHSALAESELSELYIFHLLPYLTRRFEYRLTKSSVIKDQKDTLMGKSGIAMTPNFVFSFPPLPVLPVTLAGHCPAATQRGRRGHISIDPPIIHIRPPSS